MFALIILICVAGKPCDPQHADIFFQSEFMPLDRCQFIAVPKLQTLPPLPDGQVYAAACAGQNHIGQKV